MQTYARRIVRLAPLALERSRERGRRERRQLGKADGTGLRRSYTIDARTASSTKTLSCGSKLDEARGHGAPGRLARFEPQSRLRLAIKALSSDKCERTKLDDDPALRHPACVPRLRAARSPFSACSQKGTVHSASPRASREPALGCRHGRAAGRTSSRRCGVRARLCAARRLLRARAGSCATARSALRPLRRRFASLRPVPLRRVAGSQCRSSSSRSQLCPPRSLARDALVITFAASPLLKGPRVKAGRERFVFDDHR